MSHGLCIYKQQQHSKLLTPVVFKMFVFQVRFNTCTKTRESLPDDCISNALIPFVCQDTLTQFVDVIDPPFADLLLHY